MYHNLFLFLGVKRTLYHTGDPIVVCAHLAYTVLVASKMAHFISIGNIFHKINMIQVQNPRQKISLPSAITSSLLMCLQGISYHPPLEDSSQMSVNQK